LHSDGQSTNVTIICLKRATLEKGVSAKLDAEHSKATYIFTASLQSTTSSEIFKQLFPSLVLK